MRTLKLALAWLLSLALVFGTLACSNTSSSDDTPAENNNNGGNNGNNDANTNSSKDSMKFDLTNAASFFAGKASSATTARTVARADDKNILMKMDLQGNVTPAVTLSDDMDFYLYEIMKNPVTGDLFLFGRFTKFGTTTSTWVDDYDSNGNVIGGHEEWNSTEGWRYEFIRVAQDGTWHGVPKFSYMNPTRTINKDDFDKNGAFYFPYTDYSTGSPQSIVYKYSGNNLTSIPRKDAFLGKVLYNGAVIFSISNAGRYIKLPDGTIKQFNMNLNDSDAISYNDHGAYVPSKNVYYYAFGLEYKECSYKDAEGNYYGTTHYNNAFGESTSDLVEYLPYIVKDGKKIPVEEVDGTYKDAEGNTYTNTNYNQTWFYNKTIEVEPLGSVYHYIYTITTKYFDFADNSFKEVKTVIENDQTIEQHNSYYNDNKYGIRTIYNNSYNLWAENDNIFDSAFVSTYWDGSALYKFEIQDDLSLKCTYNLQEKGYALRNAKLVNNGNTIYFLGIKGNSYDLNSTQGVFKISDYGEPVAILKGEDENNFKFKGNVSFANSGKFIASVVRVSDGISGTLQGSMETGEYKFTEDLSGIFESVTDIVINF